MRAFVITALLLAACVAWATPTMPIHSTSADGDLLWEPARDAVWVQAPYCGSTAMSSQYDYCYPFYSECADDFRLAGDRSIVQIEWWGRYW
jgi:hypothetical protein